MKEPSHCLSRDEGVTLVEIVVSLFLLALLSLAIIPMLAQGLLQSTDVGTRTAANQFLSTQMELLRTGSPPACGTTRSELLPADSSRAPLSATITAGPCASPTPRFGTVRVDVKVSRTDTGREISSASTLVYVSTG